MTTPRAPERIETERLVLRRPALADAEDVFTRYAGDPAVTRFMSFPTHRSISDARAFLEHCQTEWTRWPAGAYLICARTDGALLGSTGFTFETELCATTGYILATDAWGLGLASEALRAVVALAPSLGLRRLQANCHPEHRPSQRVLEKCGFALEGTMGRRVIFPNLADEPLDTLTYALLFA